jgi:FtsH-binding integral membrane protein
MGIVGVPPGMAPQPGSYVPGAAASPSYYPNAKPPSGFDVEAQQAATYAGQFMEKKIRSAFVRKVVFLVAIMLGITTGVSAVFLFVVPVNEYIAGPKICYVDRIDGTETCYRGAADGVWVFYTSWALTLVMLIALGCSTTLRRKHPWNYLAMFTFTFVMSVQVGCICAYWELAVVLQAVAVTGAAVLGLTLAAIFIPWDITTKGNVLAMAGMVVFFIALITFFVAFFYVSTWWYLAISVIFALLFSAYLVYDIQMLLGHKKHACSPDEYIFAATQIYMDIIMLFLQFLQIIGIASR